MQIFDELTETKQPGLLNAALVHDMLQTSMSQRLFKQGVSIVKKSTEIGRVRVPNATLGSFLEGMTAEPGIQNLDNMSSVHQKMQENREEMPWDALELFCLKLTGICTEDPPYPSQQLNKCLRKIVELMDGFRAAEILPSDEVIDALGSRSWSSQHVVPPTFWERILLNGWAIATMERTLESWLSSPKSESHMTFAVDETMVVEVRLSKQQKCADLEMFYVTEHDSVRKGRIARLMKQVVKFCGEFKISKGLFRLSDLFFLMTDVPTTENFLSCAVNREEIEKGMHGDSPLLTDQDTKALSVEFITVQTLWRGRTDRLKFSRLKAKVRMIMTVQKYWRVRRSTKKTRQQIMLNMRNDQAIFSKLQSTMRNIWPRLRDMRRIEVHLPSISLPENRRCSCGYNVQLRQDEHFCRIAYRARDPNLFIIFVSLVPPTDDLLIYYDSVMSGNMSDAERGNDGQNCARRYRVVYPENALCFPDTFSLTALTLYSPDCLNQIKQATQGRPAYIVPGITGPQESRLCVQLGLPMLAGDPALTNSYSSKIVSRNLFTSIDVDIAVGCKLSAVTDSCDLGLEEAGRAKSRRRELERVLARVMPVIGAGIMAGVKFQDNKKKGGASAGRALEILRDSDSDSEDEKAAVLDEAGLVALFELRKRDADIRDVTAIYLSIGLTMLKHLEVQRWVIKLATQTGGHGHVYIDTKDLVYHGKCSVSSIIMGCALSYCKALSFPI